MRFFVFAAALLVAALAIPRPAFAGTLQIRDETHVLAAGDAERLRAAVAAAPFDARLVFTSDYAQADELSRFVGSLVNEANTMVVGVDPTHRHVQVHFGRGSGIDRSAWPAIETAGNSAFRDGHWANGAEAIFRSAAGSATGAPATQAQPTGATGGGSSLLLWLLLGGGVIAALAFFARRQSAYGPMNGSGYYPGGQYGGGPYGGAPQGGIGPLGGGVIGAGLGGLAGYELGKMEGERERDRDRGYGGDDRDRDAGGGGNFDAGGGGSSWDSGDSGGGGFDGGGGDGGGGSDF